VKAYELLPDGHKILYDHIKDIYFFKNQSEIFKCHLVILNKRINICFNTKYPLSREYVEFIIKTFPTNAKDKKKRFFSK
jgi:hypothetical protein